MVAKKRGLWKHQKAIFAYTKTVNNPALFVEMRLGKTLVSIRRIKTYKPIIPGGRLRSLIVCPLSVIPVWLREIRQEAPQDHIAVLRGKNAAEYLVAAFNAPQDSWSIINKEGFLRLPEIGRPFWDAIVLDESTFIKNPKSKVSRFFCEKIKGAHRWILTGTPAPESPLDYFQQWKFLHGSLLGEQNYWRFRDRYCEPDPRGYRWYITNTAKRRLVKEIGSRAFFLSRKQAGLFRKKVYEERFLTLPDMLRSEYDYTERWFEFRDGDRIEEEYDYTMQVVHKLRMMASGWIGDKLVWDGKIKEVLYLAETALEDQPFIVWVFYLDNLKAIHKALKKAGLRGRALWGETSLLDRETSVAGFQGGCFRYLVIQASLGAFGLDLSRAGASIYYDGVVRGLERIQSEDRLIHPKKREASLIIDLLSEGTVDESIHELIVRKHMRTLHMHELATAVQERRIEYAEKTLPY